MGCRVGITLFCADSEQAKQAAIQGFARLESLDRELSDYLATSHLSEINREAAQREMPMKADLRAILLRSLEIAHLSQGAFDPAAGSIVAIWRQARQHGEVPEREAIRNAVQSAGYKNIALSEDLNSIALLNPGTQLDLGGIGKGYAADQVLRAIAQCGLDQAIVDVGGDLAIGAAPPGRAGWLIQLPDTSGSAFTKFELTDCGIATSSDKHQYLKKGDRRYSHIVDPRTGQALVNAPQVTVVADDAVTADALASALSVLGPERAICLIEALGGRLVIFSTPSEPFVR
jgi:thiamine biosynthesis lipoprotein